MIIKSTIFVPFSQEMPHTIFEIRNELVVSKKLKNYIYKCWYFKNYSGDLITPKFSEYGWVCTHVPIAKCTNHC